MYNVGIYLNTIKMILSHEQIIYIVIFSELQSNLQYLLPLIILLVISKTTDDHFLIN